MAALIAVAVVALFVLVTVVRSVRIVPPASGKESREKQRRADREKRAVILTAEGQKQSQILTAEGQKQAAILTAQGEREAAILRAEGEAKAITTVFQAIHDGAPDPALLAYQYLQTLPQIAASESSKVWVVPSELTGALEGLSRAFKPKDTD